MHHPFRVMQEGGLGSLAQASARRKKGHFGNQQKSPQISNHLHRND
jgi:hypothetical protein